MNAIKRYVLLGDIAAYINSLDRIHFDLAIDASIKMIVDLVNDGEVERGTEYNQLIEAISDIKLAKKYKEGWS